MLILEQIHYIYLNSFAPKIQYRIVQNLSSGLSLDKVEKVELKDRAKKDSSDCSGLLDCINVFNQQLVIM